MPGNDIMEITILDDGTIRVETDKVSAANHVTADALLGEVGKLAGGEIKRSRKGHGLAHTHAHGEEHEYEGHKH